MYSINKIETSEIIIKNSRFITILVPITSKSNITNILDKIKEKYPKANHYCYAYITENSQKSSDDKEVPFRYSSRISVFDDKPLKSEIEQLLAENTSKFKFDANDKLLTVV